MREKANVNVRETAKHKRELRMREKAKESMRERASVEGRLNLRQRAKVLSVREG